MKRIVSIIVIVFGILFMGGGIYQMGHSQSIAHMEGPQLKDMSQDREISDRFLESNVNNEQRFDPKMMKTSQSDTKYSMSAIVLVGVGSLCLAVGVMYMFLSHFGKVNFFMNKDKIIIFILSIVLLTEAFVGGTYLIMNQQDLHRDIMSEEVEKEEIDLKQGTVVNTETILLDDYQDNILIQKGGTYTLSGTLKHAVIIDAKDEEVTLNLNGVTIESAKTGAIVGSNQKLLTIHLVEGTTNSLTDGGSSEYDACLYSASDLIIDGEGTLIVNGKQTEGEGIATEDANLTIQSGNIQISAQDDGLNAGGDQGGTITIHNGCLYIDAGGDGIDSNDDAIINNGTIFVMGSDQGGNAAIDTENGYQINGGVIVALGTDMIEKPQATSTQKSICLTLDETIQQGINVTLLCDQQEILSFQSKKAFRTVIISTASLTDHYQLYQQTSHSGELVNGIYEGGQYSGGILVE